MDEKNGIVIETHGLSKSFGQVQALRGVDLRVVLAEKHIRSKPASMDLEPLVSSRAESGELVGTDAQSTSYPFNPGS
ncbi:MAG: hypothetical protein U9R15_10615 [Chloroflexota bacterium]|nr:hypothetical protein [Chloroflexota bacterium]